MNKTPHDLAQMRKSYERAELDEAHVRAEPLDQFHHWFDAAMHAKVLEPNAMTLATADAQGRPSTRVLLLKGADERGLVWFTNYQSRKGQDLAANPYAAMQFFWGELERMVRIEGRVERVSDAESDEYYQSRPLGSRIGAWASQQSAVLPNREVLEEAWKAQQASLGDNPSRPAHWGGFRLIPDRWEFWQGRPSRLHDRIEYRLQADGTWLTQRLAP
ncbi:MAG: pyridoxamine 5'-phosphate oxidase [Aquabacterium sp.]|uniref:pyridoxamine 5'-phosphate oxidase n=1 Tax=Aquabacterium sp. TaxID=1872578 RepID=UPI003BCCB9FB